MNVAQYLNSEHLNLEQGNIFRINWDLSYHQRIKQFKAHKLAPSIQIAIR